LLANLPPYPSVRTYQSYP